MPLLQTVKVTVKDARAELVKSREGFIHKAAK